MIALEAFVSFRELRVCDLRVEPKTVRARYQVVHFSGDRESSELIYSYGKAVFDPGSRGDVNLASMMTAQVALNYGLFCERIVFEGLFDEVDRRFLENMLENTSREILANKLLVDNEFILPPFKELALEPRSRYSRAALCFESAGAAGLPDNGGGRPADHAKFAVLSSGGKDSLLSYAIIKEIGEAHPIFVNEAGRHWFTALNSYKYLAAVEPNTEKPWCNSDRVFAWMLRRLPFIRKDFAGVRADYYPVRLWTVAVFLFGVLPIVRKKSIGNILIGNEYDTSIRQHHGGLAHYGGLYDQSRYFDAAMSRYFRNKGWHIDQYSLLRSMSELLILKMLTLRYPELQKHQMSCHAAHKQGEIMRPCGRCEKCRRIVGMLSALDADPANCGYTAAQIRQCLAALGKKSVKQIGSDASHLYHLLLEKGLIEHNEHTARLGREHREITRLRFDAARSRPADVPAAVRKPLFTRLAQYADGAVLRSGGRWQDVELDDDFLLSAASFTES